jgi:hypothetical protein
LPPNDLRIAGTTDGLLILKWAYFTEIKSMNMADFKDLGARPWPDHQRQVNIYMGLSPQALGAQVTAANIVVTIGGMGYVYYGMGLLGWQP